MRTIDKLFLTLIIPVFNEGSNIERLISRLSPIVEKMKIQYEILFIDDGSSDETLSSIKQFAASNSHIRAISFSRNFGKDIAIAAGLENTKGNTAILMDADLQHPPEIIETFVAKWLEGYDMVYGQRIDRASDGHIRRALTHSFYHLFERFGEVKLPDGAGDFRLLDRKVIDVIRQMPERARFSKGLYAWVGFKSIGVPFEVAHRAAGLSKWNFRKLFRFAFDGITSFSSAPLKVWTFVGVIVSAIAFIYALIVIFKTLVFGTDVPGFPSLIVSVMMLSGIQLMSLGILGEYISRIFAEVKRRPLYVVAEVVEGHTPSMGNPKENM